MEEVWVVYLCLFLLVLILILRKQNPDLEAVKKEKESKSSPPPTTYYPSTPGKHLEYSEEEMEKSFEKLTSILFDSEARKREAHHEQKSHHHHRTADAETKDLTGKGPGQSQYQSSQHRVQEKTTPSGGVESIMAEIEQAVQETGDTVVHMRRRQHPTIPRRQHQGQWTEMTGQPESDEI